MGLTVTTCAQTLRLTTRDAVKLKLPSAPTAADDELFDQLIDRSSASIVAWCGRVFAREAITEIIGAFGENRLQLARTPLAGAPVGTAGNIIVLYNGAPIVDFSVDDLGRGWLYRRGGWYWTTQIAVGLTGRSIFPGLGAPLARSEEPLYNVQYVGGWVLPSQNLLPLATFPAAVDSSSVSVASVDNSFNCAALFPPLLFAGDIIQTAGFANPANNGRFIVTGTPTPSKIQVSATLTTEASGASAIKRVIVSNMPSDIEEAAIEEVKSRYLEREKASHTKRERAGAIEMDFADPTSLPDALCVTAAGLLRRYRRSGY